MNVFRGDSIAVSETNKLVALEKHFAILKMTLVHDEKTSTVIRRLTRCSFLQCSQSKAGDSEVHIESCCVGR